MSVDAGSNVIAGHLSGVQFTYYEAVRSGIV